MPRSGPPPESPYPGATPAPVAPPPPVAAPETTRRARRGWSGLLAVALVAGVAGGALSLAGAWAAGAFDDAPAPAAEVLVPPPPNATEPAVTGADGAESVPPVQRVVARSSPAVVTVTTGDSAAEGRMGSGFAISRGGLILSNAHVVGEAQTTTITFADGSEQRGEVLGRDESVDLAVIRVPELPAGLRPLPLGSTDRLVVGDGVIAIGNPFGLERTATTGIVSALKRIIRAPNGFEIQNVVQTDAAINQGNSGGPLLDAQGRVIGINSQITTGSGGNDGIGFAVPIDTLRPVVNAIVRDGRPAHAWLGVTGRTVTPAMASALGDPAVRGVALVAVDKRGPAHAAGLRAATTAPNAAVPRGGDIIVRVADRSVDDMADVSRAVSTRAVGDRLTFTVLRDGRPVAVTVALADRPDDVGVTAGPRP